MPLLSHCVFSPGPPRHVGSHCAWVKREEEAVQEYSFLISLASYGMRSISYSFPSLNSSLPRACAQASRSPPVEGSTLELSNMASNTSEITTQLLPFV
jgi:hypothetical protein